MTVNVTTHQTEQTRVSSSYSSQITTEVFLHLRYEGTDCALMVSTAGFPSHAESCKAGDFRSSFTKRLAVCL